MFQRNTESNVYFIEKKLCKNRNYHSGVYISVRCRYATNFGRCHQNNEYPAEG